jgi:hypothetical protein
LPEEIGDFIAEHVRKADVCNPACSVVKFVIQSGVCLAMKNIKVWCLRRRHEEARNVSENEGTIGIKRWTKVGKGGEA